MREREDWAIHRVREAASLFGVCDGGRYWSDWMETHHVIHSRIAAAESRAAELEGALRQIEAWDGLFASYSRRVARAALAAGAA